MLEMHFRLVYRLVHASHRISREFAINSLDYSGPAGRHNWSGQLFQGFAEACVDRVISGGTVFVMDPTNELETDRNSV